MSPALVYFIKPKGKKGPVKIGCSNTPADRLEALGAWSPWPLEVMGSVPGSFKEEQYLHNCFAKDHQHREWFKATPRLIEAIKKIISAGTIDAVRGELEPEGNIRKARKRKPISDGEKLRQSYTRRVYFCQQRVRKTQEAWHAPKVVDRILDRWSGGRYWSKEKKEYYDVAGVVPTSDERARLDEYLADPAPHSIIPEWRLPKDPICIPIFSTEEIPA